MKQSSVLRVSLFLIFVMFFTIISPIVENVVFADEFSESIYLNASELDSLTELDSVELLAVGGGGSSGGGGAGGSWYVFSLDRNELWKKELKSPHIFSKDHINNGIMTLGKDKPAIFTKIVQVAFVASKVLKTLEGSKDIYTVINGVATTVRMYLAKGEVISLNAFVGYSARTLGEAIDLKNKRF